MNLYLFFYNLVIRSYTSGLWIASLFSNKAKKWIQGRKKILSHIERSIIPGKKYIWIHCASVGEFEQGRPLLEKIKNQHPTYAIILTFFSSSGYELRKNYDQAEHVFYLPTDTQKNATQFLTIIQPKLAIFVKYEFWYHYLNLLNRNKIPTFLISAIFRPSQIFFKWYGSFFQDMLKHYQHIFVQNESSEKLLQTIEIENVSIAPDTRFDRVIQISREVNHFPIIASFVNNNKVMICGSTWPEDENILCSFINDNPFPDLKFIIAPHEISEVKIKKLRSVIHKNTILYSEAKEKTLKEFNVLIIDNVGMLSSLYQYGDIAYIGGGFGAGIHNILEAAVYGMPVYFGPNYQKFKEAKDLISLGGAYSIDDKPTFIQHITTLINKEHGIKEPAVVTEKYVLNNKGGTNIIFEFIQQYFYD